MKIISKLLLVIFTFFIGSMIFIKLNPKVITIMFPKSEKNKMIYHSSSMNVKILKKYTKKENGRHNFVDVQNLNPSFEKFTIIVKNRDTWNSIRLNQTYFVNVGWDNHNWSNEIAHVTYLLQLKEIAKN